MATIKDMPIGIKIFRILTNNCPWNVNKDFWYRTVVLVLTFISYMSYHFTRKPVSVVKNVLHPNCTNSHILSGKEESNINCSGWAPFDGNDAGKLFGALDSAFLFAYAFAMFISGIIAERVNLRYFLSLGMILSGLFCYLFGIAKTLNIHSLAYFIIVQVFMGIFQTTGWPAVVSVVGHWFGKGKRGLIFGIWNSHTSIGNIVGTLIAGYYVETNWGYSFIVPGLLMGIFGFLVFLFLVVHPEDVGCTPPQPIDRAGANTSYMSLPQREELSSEEEVDEDEARVIVGERVPYRRNKSSATEKSPILVDAPDKAIGFIDALRIPLPETIIRFHFHVVSVRAVLCVSHTYLGLFLVAVKIIQDIGFLYQILGVVEFSLSLFFSKLVSYTFLYWLPYYISSSTSFGPSLSADLSTLFDVGGILGAIVAGLITDATNMSATVCVVMLFLAVPSLFLYEAYGSFSETVNVLLLLVSGAFVNGPYALITTAVSAELGTHESLQGSSKALATVTAIIDGTGSIGAAVGPLIAGLVSPAGWDKVFYFLMASDVAALLLLIRLTLKEISKFRNMRHRLRTLS